MTRLSFLEHQPETTIVTTTATVSKRIEQTAVVPYSQAARGVQIAPLDADFHYAFNFDAPNGVKLLRAATAKRLVELKHAQTGAVPEIDNYSTPEDRILAKHKLLFVRSDPDAYRHSPPPPEKSFHIWLHVINGCNFRCSYCYIPHLQSHINPAVINSQSMSSETANSVIARILSFCSERGFGRLHIKFAGGEPTLNTPLIEYFCRTLMHRSEGIRITFGMISNGSFSFEELQPLLSQYDMSLSISVDGFEHSHDRVRFSLSNGQRIGSWSTVERNVTLLIAHNIEPYLLYTVTKQNSSALRDFARWCHARLLGFRLSPVRLRRVIPEAEINAIASDLSSLYSTLGETMPLSLRFERDARFAEWNLRKRKLSACGSCRNYLAVTEQGEIRPCQMSGSTGFNVRQHSVADAIQGFEGNPTTRTIVDPALKIGACTACEYYHVCSGGCPQHTLAVYGIADTPSPWCKLYGQIMPVYLKAKAMHLRRQLEAVCPQAEQRGHVQ